MRRHSSHSISKMAAVGQKTRHPRRRGHDDPVRRPTQSIGALRQRGPIPVPSDSQQACKENPFAPVHTNVGGSIRLLSLALAIPCHSDWFFTGTPPQHQFLLGSVACCPSLKVIPPPVQIGLDHVHYTIRITSIAKDLLSFLFRNSDHCPWNRSFSMTCIEIRGQLKKNSP